MLAWLIRAALVVVPLAVSWLVVRLAMVFVERPDGRGPVIVWFVGALALSSVVFGLVRRLIGHFSPLGVLFSLSLTFPDAAPSRMRAFLRPGDAEDGNRIVTLPGSGHDGLVTSRRLAALVTRVGRREARSGRHGDRVRGYAELIAEELGLAEDDIERLRWATLLHDVGLLDVPRRVLETRGALAPDDRDLVEQHPVHAVDHLAPFAEWLGPWAGAATDHHERWDGTGYPAGSSGEEISLAGRIVAVADAYDAMTALRSYRRPISPAAARRELVDNAGTQFDPAVVRAFLEVGISPTRSGLGFVGALAEIPGRVMTAVSGAGIGAGTTIAVASAVFVVTTAAVVPSISATVEEPAVQVSRVVDESGGGAGTTVPSSTEPRPKATTTRVPTTTAPTTTVTTTTVPPTTTARPTTTAPRSRAPSTTVVAPVPTAAPVTTVAPAYPTVPPAPPDYPTT